ncbi:carbohydrate-binding family 9-like protein [Mucilaginibacter sabulilitoris]|uniref:Carbohydrate-binding family 9-like protein n=1 Tax=Mucilaginibacter sabulilitoris TaxID=1173583 RepID=A0ABZ0THK8_9SPHI|nr:carbohydrate-binding family 9-like protein [Mucilaginibacter sabulilitoris]WPU92681.1 carbohydrate-binding family 9-like protein [Mucilaginibacter sabulilitoris]
MNTLPVFKKIKGLSLLKTGLIVFIVFGSGRLMAQDAFKGLENLFTIPQNYVVKHTAKAPAIDGDIDENIWQQAKWTADFTDIEGDLKPNPSLQTNIKMLWDDSCVYVAARLYDPHVWATLKNHDDIVFRDNDFELFVDPQNTTHSYYEIEVNAINTIFDLYLNKPYRNMGSAVPGWDAHGLRTAVKIQGTLNNPKDKDKGWTVEMAIPFKAINPGFKAASPQHGTLWRINFSRVEWDAEVKNGEYVKLKDTASGHDLPEHNWVWSPQGVINMHYPERWGYLLFSNHSADDVVFEMPYAEQQKKYLWLIYYRQKEWYKQKHEYAQTLKDLGIESGYDILKKFNNLQLESTKHQFMAFITEGEGSPTYTINQDGFVEPITNNHHE